MKESAWMGEARALAAQCWCDDETKDREMDVVLAEAVARRIAAWMDIAAEYARNQEYYVGLLDACVPALAPDIFVCDDGSISESPLRAKVPELVARLAESSRTVGAVDPHASDVVADACPRATDSVTAAEQTDRAKDEGRGQTSMMTPMSDESPVGARAPIEPLLKELIRKWRPPYAKAGDVQLITEADRCIAMLCADELEALLRSRARITEEEKTEDLPRQPTR